MKPIKLILRNMNVLNLLLLGVAITLFLELDYPLLRKQIFVEPVGAEVIAILSEGKMASESSPSYADFISIAEKNLFHPEREIPKAEKAVVPKPELTLHGTLITDDLSIAYIEDKRAPSSTTGRAKRQTALKKGSSIGGYVFQEIEANRIMLVKGKDKLILTLDGNEKRKGSEGAPQASMGVAVPSRQPQP